MKKNGFVFIETIVTVVVLSASLLLIYNSYNSSISTAKERVYYDDVSYIYRTNFVRKFLEDYSNVESIKSYAFTDTYVVPIGPGYDTMFTPAQNSYRTSLEYIYNNFHINQMILLRSNYITDCFEETQKCKGYIDNLSYNLRQYIRSLNETDFDYYLIVEYAEKINDSNGKFEKCTLGIDTKCSSYYVSLGI